MSNAPDFHHGSSNDLGSEPATDNLKQEGHEPNGASMPNGDDREVEAIDFAIVIGADAFLPDRLAPFASRAAKEFAGWLHQGSGLNLKGSRVAFLPEADATGLRNMMIEVRERFLKSSSSAFGTLVLYISGRGRVFPELMDASITLGANGPGPHPDKVSVRELIGVVRQIAGFKNVITVLDLAADDGKQRKSDAPALFPAAASAGVGPVERDVLLAGVGWGAHSEKSPAHGRFTSVLLNVMERDDFDLSTEAFHARLEERLNDEPEPRPELHVLVANADPPPAPPPPKLNTAVPDQLDIASTVDQLNRKPFARILARRIFELQEHRKREGTPEHERDGAYVIHLHGRWGEGKSTVLNFIKEELRPKNAPEGWVVVEFNAWRTQSTRPPWWTLVREIRAQAFTQVPRDSLAGIRWCWDVWRFRVEVLPWVIAAVVMFTVAWMVGHLKTDEEKGLGGAAELVAALVAGAITLVAMGRTLMFGSNKAAQAFMDQRADATRPIKQRFQKLIKAIRRPVIVFVDDVDRCDKSYVVELLEGIQTLFRDAPVTFLIAADRKWICRSFEKHFDDFNGSVGDPTRPLGYLFLEKLFQLSVSLPPLSVGLQKEFAQALLKRSGDPKKAEALLEAAERNAEDKLDAMPEHTDMDRLIDETKDVVEKQAIQRVVAKRLASLKNDAARKHELDNYAEFMERNPRAMKRLLNAYGMQQALNKLKDPRVPTDHLVRWTIIELRWPLFAEHACMVPGILDLVDNRSPATGAAALLASAPVHVRDLLTDPSLVKVVFADDGSTRVLSASVLLEILGTTQRPKRSGTTPPVDVPPEAAPASA